MNKKLVGELISYRAKLLKAESISPEQVFGFFLDVLLRRSERKGETRISYELNRQLKISHDMTELSIWINKAAFYEDFVDAIDTIAKDYGLRCWLSVYDESAHFYFGICEKPIRGMLDKPEAINCPVCKRIRRS